jgi:SEC-C motif
MKAKPEVVVCVSSCPEWGRLDQSAASVRCGCGRMMNICLACLQAGRRTDCGCVAERSTEQAKIGVPAKIGRNQPCPCGSGKKFKKCGCQNPFIFNQGSRDRVANAFHESAHAVFGVLFDFPIEFVTIVPFSKDGEDFVGICNFEYTSKVGEGGRLEGWRARLYLFIQVAGPAVEWRRGTMVYGAMPSSDARIIDRLLGQLPEALKETVIEAAVGFVNADLDNPEIWQAISHIAQMLLSRGRIEGAEIRRDVLAIAPKHFISRERQYAAERVSRSVEGMRRSVERLNLFIIAHTPLLPFHLHKE